MANTNQVFLAGRLARDPELRYTPYGIEECTLTVCHNWKGRDGSGKALYIPVVCYANQAKACAEYLVKGHPVLVEGMLRSRSFKSKREDREVTQLYIRAKSVNFLSAGIAIPPADEHPGVEFPDSG